MAQASNSTTTFPRRSLLAPGETAEIAASCEADISSLDLLRVSGDLADQPMIEQLENAFSSLTGTQFVNWFHGPESTLAGVYTGTADIAFMPREIREPMERMAFQWSLLVKPFEFSYANCAIDHPGDAVQLGIFVHPSNPVEAFSLDDLDAIFGAEHRRANGNIRKWGQIGICGKLANTSIEPVLTSVDAPGPLFFRRLVMKDSRKWNTAMHQKDVVEAIRFVEANHGAIALLPAARMSARLRSVAISMSSMCEAIKLSRDSIIDRTYPLVRSRTVIVHRPLDRPIRIELERFLRFLLSDQAQAIVDKSGMALPLDSATIDKQLARLA